MLRHAVWLLMLFCLSTPLARPGVASAQTARPLGVADLVAVAEERNPSIAAARHAVTAAEAAVTLARSGRGPTVTAAGTVGTSGGSTTSPSDSTSASITTSYVLYDGGQTAHAVRQAEANFRAARLALEAARQDVARSVALAYVDVLRAERSVLVREQVVVQAREALRLAEGQFRAGVVARADVVRAQAGLAAAEGDLLSARNDVDQARASLNVAIGALPVTPLAVALPPVAPPLTVAAAELLRLVEQRPEFRRALVQVEAAEAAVALARAGGGLQVTLDGGVTQSWSPSTQTTYEVGATVRLPLADAGRARAQVAQAAANLAAARANIETTRLTVQQQANSAVLSILSARARVASARAQLAFAQESLRLAQGRYAAGTGPILEVIDAQTVLVQADVALAAAEFDEIAGVFSLRYALGRSVVDGAI